MAFVLLADAASAQSQPQPLSAPPADKYAVAPGGVDMRTGTYTLQTTDLSGGGGDSALSLTRILGSLVVDHNNPFGNFSSNWDIMLTQKRINIDQGTTADNSGVDYQVSVRFGGRSQTFRAYSTIGFTVASLAGYAQLTYTGDRNAATAIYTFNAGDGTKVVFRPPSGHDCSTQVLCAYASSVTFPDGTIYNLNYDNPTPSTPNTIRLKSVVGNRGYALLFEYGSGASLITKACVINLTQMLLPTSSCPTTAPATTAYDYVSVNGSRLSKVTDAAAKDWTFGYTGGSSGMTMAFTKPGATSPWLTNTIQFGMDIDTVPIEVVTAQNFADGRSYTYGFVYSPQRKPDEPPTIAGGAFTDNLSRTTTVAYDFPIMPGTGLDDPCRHNGCPFYYVPEDGSDPNYYQQTTDPATIIDPLGRTTINHFCDPNVEATPPGPHFKCLVSLLQWTQDPEGGKTYFTWDMANRNVTAVRKVAKPGTGTVADITSSATYDCTYRPACAKPTSVTDPRGKVSTYTYDPTHGGVLTETSPADANGLQAVKRYAYVQRYAWISDGASGYVQSAFPVWLLASEKTCRATATVSGACAGGASDEVTTIYEYGPDSGPNNLLLRGVAVTADTGGTMATLRTCYAYDPLGRKISETKPAGTTSLSVCP